MKIRKICKKIIEMDCLLAKTLNLQGKKQKKNRKSIKGVGALIRAGAHNRDNTVVIFQKEVGKETGCEGVKEKVG